MARYKKRQKKDAIHNVEDVAVGAAGAVTVLGVAGALRGVI